MIELMIQGGARAGTRVRVNADTVLIGRHADAQLRLDPEKDLDVSSRHAQLTRRDGEWFLTDLGSTNGTFMHGVKVDGEWMVQDGDVISLGANGPTIEIHTNSANAEPPRTNVASSPEQSLPAVPPRRTAGAEPPLDDTAPRPPRMQTQERIAIAVKHETAKLRRGLLAVGALLVVGIGAAYWVGHRESTRQLDELRTLLADNDASSSLLRARLAGLGDTALLSSIGRRANESLMARVKSGKLSEEEAQRIRDELQRSQEAQRSLAAVDLPAINARNAPATAFLVTELGGKAFAGTAFGIAPGGLMVTNRHLVRTENGVAATRLAVKFRDTRTWVPAHVVKVADSQDDDLALIQLDVPGTYPVVAGIAGMASDLREGSPVVTIGYPLGLDTRMEGSGDDFVAKSTLFPGTVSKQLSTLMQVAAWAGHGSSGSPVLGASGNVIGVVWGGPRDSNGQLVYAVPAARLAEFVKAEAPAIVR